MAFPFVHSDCFCIHLQKHISARAALSIGKCLLCLKALHARVGMTNRHLPKIICSSILLITEADFSSFNKALAGFCDLF